jgi:hypothetical protein
MPQENVDGCRIHAPKRADVGVRDEGNGSVDWWVVRNDLRHWLIARDRRVAGFAERLQHARHLILVSEMPRRDLPLSAPYPPPPANGSSPPSPVKQVAVSFVAGSGPRPSL